MTETREVADHPFDAARLRFPDIDKDKCFRCELPRSLHTTTAEVCGCEIEVWKVRQYCGAAQEIVEDRILGFVDSAYRDNVSSALREFAAHMIDATLIHLGERSRAYRTRQSQKLRNPDRRP